MHRSLVWSVGGHRSLVWSIGSPKPPEASRSQPKPLKTYKNRHGTMKNQSGTIKTNLELDRVVMGGSSGNRRLPGGSDHFSLQTHRQTDTHHNIYIIIIIILDL